MFDKIDWTTTLLGVGTCALAILFVPFLSVEEYNFVHHTTSELGGQKMPYSWLMNWGLIGLGFGAAFDAKRRWPDNKLQSVLFIGFGLTYAASGIYSAAPLDETLKFRADWDLYHLYASAAAEVLFVAGAFSFALIKQKKREKMICVGAGIAAAVLYGSMYQLPEIAGLVERVMLLILFVWLVVYLPPPRKTSAPAQEQPDQTATDKDDALEEIAT